MTGTTETTDSTPGPSADTSTGRLDRLEAEVARLASLLVVVQGSLQALLSRGGKLVGVPSAAVSPELSADLQRALDERMQVARETEEDMLNETKFAVSIRERWLASALAGDRFELNQWLKAAREREERPAREAAERAERERRAAEAAAELEREHVARRERFRAEWAVEKKAGRAS